MSEMLLKIPIEILYELEKKENRELKEYIETLKEHIDSLSLTQRDKQISIYRDKKYKELKKRNKQLLKVNRELVYYKIQCNLLG